MMGGGLNDALLDEAETKAEGASHGAPRVRAPRTAIGQFAVLRLLGRGGMGEVYLARDLVLGRLVALKFLPKRVARRPEAVALLLNEARLTAQLNHPNVVTLHSVGEHDGTPFVVLEYVEGESLSQRMHEDSLGVRETVRVVLGIARATAAAHACGVLHRDLKPSNVVTAADGRVRVLDFGIAKFLDGATPGYGGSPEGEHDRAPGDAGDSPFDTGMICGSPLYMAPEQWRGDDSTATDVWAIGVILYRLLVGRHPFEGTAAQLHALVTSPDPFRATDALRDLPSDLSRLVIRCLEKHPAQRPSAAEIVAILEGIHLRAGHEAVGESSPFQGLAPFTEEQAESFFGRDAELEAFDERIRLDPILVVVGASGAGKSSFVRAGVIPRLRDSAHWTVIRLRPGRAPMAALALTLTKEDRVNPTLSLPKGSTSGLEARRVENASGRTDPPPAGGPGSSGVTTAPDPGNKIPSTPPEAVADVFGADADAQLLARELRRSPAMLSVVLNRLAERSSSRVLLFVDQVEELVTLCPDEAERRAFLDTVCSATADPREPVRVVLAVRDDFFGRVPWGDSLRDVGKGVVWLRVPGEEALRETIVAPLRQRGYAFDDPSVVDQMLASVRGESGSLPLLQFVLSVLWRERDRAGRRILRGAYEACGQVAGALAEHADQVVEAMPPAQRKTARALLLRMVTPQGTRRPVPQDELLAGLDDGAASVLARLVAARLVATRRDGEDAERFSAELVHEALITRWPRLARWIADISGDGELLGRVDAAATEWEKGGRREGLLWRGEAAEQARAWHDAYTKAGREPLLARDEDYLRAVTALLRRTERVRRSLFLGAFTTLAVFVLSLSYFGWRAKRGEARASEEARRAAEAARRAERGDLEARRQAMQARNATRMAALSNLASDPTTRLAILREIEGDVAPFKWQEEARSALHAPVSGIVLDGHTEYVVSVAFSPDGRRVASGGVDRTIRIENADGSGDAVVLRGHTGVITSVAFSPDGRKIASAALDGTMRLWSADGAGEPKVYEGKRGVSIAFSPDGQRLAATANGAISIWNIDGSGSEIVLKGHTDKVQTVAFSPDGRTVVSASWDRTVRIWSADGRGPTRILRGHTDKVMAAAFSPDGTRILSGGYDKVVRVWSLDGRKPPLELRGHTEYVLGVAFSPDGEQVAASSGDRTARIWRADGKGEPLVLAGHTEAVYGLGFSPDGRRIATASADKTVRIWDAHPSNEPIVLRGHTDTVYTVAFSPDGARVASGATDATIRLWSADGTGDPVVLKGHGGRVNSVAFSPDGARLVSGANDDTARVWRLDGRGPAVVLKGHTALVYGVAFGPDGAHVATASFDKTVRLWNADGSGEPVVLAGHTDRVGAVAFSPDGRELASLASDKTVRLWSTASPGAGRILFTGTEMLAGLAFSPDGKELVFGGYDNVVRIVRVDGSGEPRVFKGHSNYVEATIFSPDGRFVASSSGDETIRIFPPDGSGETAVLGGHMVDVESIAFSPDGRRIASASDDKLVRIWHDLAPIRLGDPRLWGATTYCLSETQYTHLLGFPEDLARESREACVRRVATVLGGGPAPSAAR